LLQKLKSKRSDKMAVKTYSYKNDKNVKLSEHFSVWEFRCKDGTDKMLINTELVDILEKLFKYLDCEKIDIISGYRTPTHSVKVGGYSTDQHTKGNAADFKCMKKDGTYYSSNEICCALEDLNHKGGIGRINKTTNVHVDTRGYKCWFDEVNGEKTTNSWYAYFGIKKPDIKGDVDGNGKITAADARLALRASAKLENLTDKQKKSADIDGDGKVTAKDAREILQKASGKKS
jgi:uncharacterized protein YcbK (DUF882 family)